MPTLHLTEWERSGPQALDSQTRQALEQAFNAQVTTSGPELYEVTAGGRIGTVTVGETAITVSPRFGIDRVLFMIAYANDPHTWRDQTSELGATSGLVDGMTALFVRSCAPLLAQGLLRDYRRVEQDAPMVKGRVLWPRQARRPAPVPLAVRFDVHDDDILENQLIRAAAAVLRPLVQSPSAAGQLSRLWRHISHLTPVADPLAAFERIRWTRRDGHYRPIMDLARVILAGDILEVRPGAAQVRGFTLTMHEVFETFVRRALFGGDPATGDLGIQPKTPLHLDDGKRIPLIPDLGLYSGGRWRFVGDVKYKRDADNHNDDIYQVLGYAVAADLPETTLIYAAGPQETTTHIVTSGGTRIHVHRLDLTRPPDDVLRRLREIAAATLPASRVTA
ncbi:MAG: hypothetical protein KDB28_15025 [Tetrasphaera sp.]|nr:hypothetical protein [Tetrasphaera sp.]